MRVGAAVGISIDTFDRVTALKEADVDAIFIDTAHGHSKGVLNIVDKIKSTYPSMQIISR